MPVTFHFPNLSLTTSRAFEINALRGLRQEEMLQARLW